MNKNDLIAKIADETRMTKADCQRVIEEIIALTKKSVKDGDQIRLVGFGTFLRSKRSARRGRNPQTGKEIKIPAHFVPRFRPGKDFRDYVR